MRRQDIQLLALARQGDVGARCEAGRRYLQGTDGFRQHIATGLDYLNHANVRDLPQTARIIAESLALETILLQKQESALERAAAAGSVNAQVKLAVWLLVGKGRAEDAARWFDMASKAGNDSARLALLALGEPLAERPLLRLLRTLALSEQLNIAVVALFAARQAFADNLLDRLTGALQIAVAFTSGMTPELAELVVAAVQLAEETGRSEMNLNVQCVEAALEARTNRGDREAAYALGRALCGIQCGRLGPTQLAANANMRKGVALMLRAADAGCHDAWLHLYRMHGDHKLSVANPQMARFCLEKAAVGGQPEAQRKLGALILRGSDSLDDSEQAIQWLHQAASMNDKLAEGLLRSLVLPLAGSDADAMSSIELIRRSDPWLAMRMHLSRHFGLTKLEALCVDPSDGLRPWGLVVGKNPFISQARLSAARAIPALSDEAIAVLRAAASFFSQSDRDTLAFEGDLRRRSLRQRRAFERHCLDETMFFSTATSMTLEALRFGPKWAFRAKEPLSLALAA